MDMDGETAPITLASDKAGLNGMVLVISNGQLYNYFANRGKKGGGEKNFKPRFCFVRKNGQKKSLKSE